MALVDRFQGFKVSNERKMMKARKIIKARKARVSRARISSREIRASREFLAFAMFNDVLAYRDEEDSIRRLSDGHRNSIKVRNMRDEATIEMETV